MANFFNGADSAEVAGLNLSNANLNIVVKQYLSIKDNVEAQTEILNSDKGPFEREVDMCMRALDDCPELREYSLDDVRGALARRVNTMSRNIAKNHGFSTYLKLNRGKVQKAELAIEHKPQGY